LDKDPGPGGLGHAHHFGDGVRFDVEGFDKDVVFWTKRKAVAGEKFG
jgi:hypothetical protein